VVSIVLIDRRVRTYAAIIAGMVDRVDGDAD
jgi:hypothetical protein